MNNATSFGTGPHASFDGPLSQTTMANKKNNLLRCPWNFQENPEI
jgi:hypothetical protein